MPATPHIFYHHAHFDPSGDFDAFLKAIPGKWAVYLMTDADDKPVQLLCVKNLRYSLRRRLGPEDVDAGPSRRVDYRGIVRALHNPNFAEYARLCGATGIRVERREQLDAAMTELFAVDGPVLLCVEQDPELL